MLYNIKKTINIMSDGGPENKGVFLNWIQDFKAPPQITKITAFVDGFNYSNNMSEVTHSIYKTEFMKKQFSLNIKQHEKDLEYFVDNYNMKRYPCALYGLTPFEVLSGKTPNKHMFKNRLAKSKQERIIENKNFNNCY